MTEFQINDPSLESQWRALILFGKNSATYKFAFAKSLLELIEKETTSISLKELAKPFSLVLFMDEWANTKFQTPLIFAPFCFAWICLFTCGRKWSTWHISELP